MGWNWALFLYHVSTGRSFCDTLWFFKFPYSGMKSGICRNVSKFHMYSLSTTEGRNSAFIFALWAAIFEIRANFQNFHIWEWILESEEMSQSYICTLFLHHGLELKLIFALRAAFFKIRADFQRCICTLFLPHGVEIKLIFALRAVFEIRANLQNFHIWACNLEFGIWRNVPKLHIYSLSNLEGRN